MVDRADTLELRETTDADLPQNLKLLESSLGWVPDELYGAYYRWTHHENPFGRSPAWVAVRGERVVGLQPRCRFVRHGRTWEAVRAVETATHRNYHGRGIFRRLTTSSVEVLSEQGVTHVFNTPNERSRPGYHKIGCKQVGYLPLLGGGPVLSLRELAESGMPPLDEWELTMGDIELF